MSSNMQGRKRGKSVSFRGQSNDSNFYDNRSRNDFAFNDNNQRNSYREQSNFNGYNVEESESRIVKLLPDANLTISVNNDYRGSNRGRSRGSRGILKSWSFRDDTEVQNRSGDYYNRGPDYNDDYNMNSRRGFETYSFQSGSNRSRGRGRGFHNRQQNVSRYSDVENADGDRDRDRDGERDRFRDKEVLQGNDATRGRSKSVSDRSRRSRGSFRGRYRRRAGNPQRTSESSSEVRNSGDGNLDGESCQQERDESDMNPVEHCERGADEKPLEQQQSSGSPPAVVTEPSTDESESNRAVPVDTSNNHQSPTSAMADSSVVASDNQLVQSPLPSTPANGDCPSSDGVSAEKSVEQECESGSPSQACTEPASHEDFEQQSQTQADSPPASGPISA